MSNYHRLIAYKRDFPHDIISVERNDVIKDNTDIITGVTYDEVFPLDEEHSFLVKKNTTRLAMHITAEAMVPICTKCKTAIRSYYKYCPMCGRKVIRDEENNGAL